MHVASIPCWTYVSCNENSAATILKMLLDIPAAEAPSTVHLNLVCNVPDHLSDTNVDGWMGDDNYLHIV